MDMDQDSARVWFAALALLAFNVPVLIAAWKLRNVDDFSQALREKDAATGQLGPVSYSRVTGMIGAVVVASLFWVMSNITIWTAIVSPRELAGMLSGVSNLFYVGAALFIPYAFNQLKTLVQ